MTDAEYDKLAGALHFIRASIMVVLARQLATDPDPTSALRAFVSDTKDLMLPVIDMRPDAWSVAASGVDEIAARAAELLGIDWVENLS